MKCCDVQGTACLPLSAKTGMSVASALLSVVVAFGGLLMLGGCSNDPNPKPMHEKRADGTPWLVRYAGMPDDPRSMDPQVAYDQMSRRVLEPVMETLLEYDPFKTDPYEVIPLLLQEIPKPVSNPDGTVTYRCKLKQGVYFTDDPCFPGGKGRQLVAGDLHYAFQRLCDPEVESPVSGPLSEYVAGMKEAFESAKHAPMDYSKPMRGVEVLNDFEFNLHLLKPYPQIVYWLAMQFTSPVAREAVEYYDGKAHPDGPGGKMVVRPTFAFHPVGTGPFIMKRYTPGSVVHFVRNPNYTTSVFPSGGWPAEQDEFMRGFAGHPLPLVDEVVMTVFREIQPIWLLTEHGYLDGMGVSKDAFTSLVTPSQQLTPKYRERGMRLEKDVEVSTFYLSFNLQDPVVGPNKKLRQALSCALNVQGYVDIFFNGVPPVAHQLIPPGIAGYQPEFKNPYGYNLEKARQLIAEAGYPNGRDPKTGAPLQLTVDVSATSAQERQMAEYMQRQLESLGVKVSVLENTFARMTEKEDQGNFQMASGTGWGADYPDPENFMFLFYSKNMPPTGKNISRFQNAEFDALFEKMATMDSTPERIAMIHRMNEILIEECPIILEYNKAYYSLVQPFAPRTQNNTMIEGGLKWAWVDHDLRERKRREWNPVPLWPVGLGVAIVVSALGYAVLLNRRRNV